MILICLVWLCKNLSKLDHVQSDHYRSLSCMVAITAAYPISICWYDVSSVSVSLCLHLLSLDTVSHHNYDTRVAAHFANPKRFHLGFSQRFLCFKASSWWNTIPSPLTTDKYFPAFCKDYSYYLLAHVYVYVFL